MGVTVNFTRHENLQEKNGYWYAPRSCTNSCAPSDLKLDLEARPQNNHYASLVRNLKVAVVSNFTLESGCQLSQVPVAYSTWGALNEEASNVLVVCHALTGSSDIQDWWPSLLGSNPLLHNLLQPTRIALRIRISTDPGPADWGSLWTYVPGDDAQGRCEDTKTGPRRARRSSGGCGCWWFDGRTINSGVALVHAVGLCENNHPHFDLGLSERLGNIME